MMVGTLRSSGSSSSFDLDAVVPADHLVRKIAAVLDLSWVHTELAPHYSPIAVHRSIRCS
jgi:hypothetical protein